MARRSDPRFDDMHHAPIFKKVKKDNFKTKLDDRFKTVLTDDRFNSSALGEGVDKHGKKKSSSKKKAASDLKAFYNIEDKEPVGKVNGGEDKAESRLDYLSKLSRGEISGSGSDSETDDSDDSSQSSDSSSDDSDSDDAYTSRKGGALSIPGDEIVTTRQKSQKGVVEVGETPAEEEDCDDEVDVENSNRLAIQNCDWDNMSAEDIMAILQSFCSTMSLQSGSVKSVTVYPSDYGLERIEAENLHGPPKSIWNKTTTMSEDKEIKGRSDDDSDAEGDGSDASDDDGGNIHILQKNHPEELLKSGISVNKKVRKKKEFDRDPSSAGLVFNLDNADSDDESHHPTSGGSSEHKPSSKAGDDINSLALREYELSKLRYYFAIAELDNVSVAEKLYSELDGIEFEHSSVALDLRFVPNDVSFDGRKVRDRYEGTVSAGYTPPEGFVVNALQKTNVECTWDNDDGKKRPLGQMQLSAGADDDDDIMMIPKGSTKKNTTASAWRRLQESDMSQYMASESDSDDNEELEGGDVSKKQRAANLRKLLLGGEGGEEEGSEDDFFMHSDEEGGASESSDEDNDDIEDDTDKVMTFVPTENDNDEEGGTSKKKSRKQKKAEKQANQEDWEVPQETLKRLREEKRAEKKKSKRSRSNISEAGDETKNTELELMFAGDDDSDEDRRDRLNFTKKQLAAAEDLKLAAAQNESSSKKKKKKLSKSKAKLLAETKGDTFELDMTDSRFSKVLEGDADYGIDRMSNEYRPTVAMERILNERNNRKIAADRKAGNNGGAQEGISGENKMGMGVVEKEEPVSSKKLSLLASKLKKNFNKK